MKKINYLLLGMAGLAMASCSQNDLVGPANGDGNVQITVNLPGEAGTRTMGDGMTAKVLKYAVYEPGSTTNEATLLYEGEVPFGASLSTTLNLNLLKKNYIVALFAQSEMSLNTADATADSNGVYDFDAENQTITVNYANMNSKDNQSDAYDCFYNVVTINGSTATSMSVTLYRPVAQINWGTNDLNGNGEIEDIFGTDGEYILTTLTTSGLPTTFNFMEGTVSDTDLYEGALTNFAVPAGAYPVEGYNYVAVQYVLAGVPTGVAETTQEVNNLVEYTATASTTYDLTLSISNSGNEALEVGGTYEADAVSVDNVPVQANYQTNIYGTLLSNNTTLNVTVQPGFANTYNVDPSSGAAVEMRSDGTVYCITPALPENVTEEMMEGHGAVAIGANGEPVYFENTGSDINKALSQYSELYFTPNATITTDSHIMKVPAGSVTIHGNGATITGGEQDFSVENTYADGSIINLTINNLNGVKVWGAPQGQNITANVTLNTCSMIGKGITDGSLSFTMLRGADANTTLAHITLNNCYASQVQVAAHTTFYGTLTLNDCNFNTVGIPVNVAKKLSGKESTVTVKNCNFDKCGIPEGITAWNYSAPVRVVDNGGPTNSITLLVDGCTFTDTQSKMDILLWDYRTNETRTSYPVNLTVENCTPAKPIVSTIDKVTTMGPNSPGN